VLTPLNSLCYRVFVSCLPCILYSHHLPILDLRAPASQAVFLNGTSRRFPLDLFSFGRFLPSMHRILPDNTWLFASLSPLPRLSDRKGRGWCVARMVIPPDLISHVVFLVGRGVCAVKRTNRNLLSEHDGVSEDRQAFFSFFLVPSFPLPQEGRLTPLGMMSATHHSPLSEIHS